MTIKQAVKHRKKLENQLEKELGRVFQHNTTEFGEVKKYSTKECLENYMRVSQELVQLKTAIHKAITPMIETKFRLATLKDLLYTIESLGCVSGVWTDEKTKERITYTSEITKQEKLMMIEEYDEEIARLESELETFYATTNI